MRNTASEKSRELLLETVAVRFREHFTPDNPPYAQDGVGEAGSIVINESWDVLFLESLRGLHQKRARRAGEMLLRRCSLKPPLPHSQGHTIVVVVGLDGVLHRELPDRLIKSRPVPHVSGYHRGFGRPRMSPCQDTPTNLSIRIERILVHRSMTIDIFMSRN